MPDTQTQGVPVQTGNVAGGIEKAATKESPLGVETSRTKRSVERLETVVSDLVVKLSPITPQEPSDPGKDSETSDQGKTPSRGSSVLTTQVREMGMRVREQTTVLGTLLRLVEV